MVRSIAAICNPICAPLVAQAKCSLICRNLDIRNSEPSDQWYFIGVVTCAHVRELRRGAIPVLFVCRVLPRRSIRERIRLNYRTCAVTGGS
jgi:flavin reductase (DIM6/NTAB) family NADH-FMN oxidoreductase RutF